jgi:hypothetical protein
MGKIDNILNPVERDTLILHILFTVLCALTLLAPIGATIGVRLFFLVIIYNLSLPILGVLKKHRDLTDLWLFAFILSIFQIWPDYFLSSRLEILFFPEDGLFKFGSVSGYMAGLWTIPVFFIVFIAQRIRIRFSENSAYWAAAITSLIVFGISEQTMWMLSSWRAQNVTLIGHMAVYIILPEIIFGLSAYWCYEKIKDSNHWVKVPAAFLIMLLYLGSAAYFYFLIEVVIP